MTAARCAGERNPANPFDALTERTAPIFRSPVGADLQSWQLIKGRRICRHNRATGGSSRRRNEEIVRPSRSPRSSNRGKQFGVLNGNRKIVRDDGRRSHDVANKCLSFMPVLFGGELDRTGVAETIKRSP